MEIKFKLTDVQAQALNEIKALSNKKDADESEFCRLVIIENLVRAKQQIIAQTLAK